MVLVAGVVTIVLIAGLELLGSIYEIFNIASWSTAEEGFAHSQFPVQGSWTQWGRGV